MRDPGRTALYCLAIVAGSAGLVRGEREHRIGEHWTAIVRSSSGSAPFRRFEQPFRTPNGS
jgi:hypothetical protein